MADNNLNNQNELDKEKKNNQTQGNGLNNQNNNTQTPNAKPKTEPNASANVKPENVEGNSAVKKLTTYQEQILQQTTNSKVNKKIIAIFVSIISALVIAGVGVLVYFVVKPKDTTVAAVVCDVRLNAYKVKNTTTEPTLESLGMVAEFSFREDTEDNSQKEVEYIYADIAKEYDILFVYQIDNLSDTNYVYTLDFTNLTLSNCEIEITTSLDTSSTLITADRENKMVRISSNKDFDLKIRVAVEDTSSSYTGDTSCVGSYSLTLSVA